METVLTTTPKIGPSATWFDYKNHNTAEFLVFVFPNSTITLFKVYTRTTSDKAIF